jgi:uncharacterized protein (TIGR02246 family)
MHQDAAFTAIHDPFTNRLPSLAVTLAPHPNTESSMRSQFSLRSWLYLALLLVSIGPTLASGQGIKRPTIPLRKTVDEIRLFREAYADAFNKKDTATVGEMYSPDAIMIREDGSVLAGQDAIREAMAAEAPNWPQLTITSDSMRAVGSTAWDIGTTRAGSGGGERVSHYLVVLRRGLKYWKINSLALVPESSDSAPPVRAKPSGQ